MLAARECVAVDKQGAGGEAVIVTLPWPPSILSPNARPHWAALAKARKAYRAECMVVARNAGVYDPSPEGPILMDVWFYPPDRRGRDRTNCEASLKAAFDGLADAMGVNDIRFAPQYFMGPPVKGGAVEIIISDATLAETARLQPWGECQEAGIVGA